MRVLHICSYYLSSNLFYKLFQKLSDVGVTNDVFVPLSDDDKEYWDRTEDEGANVHIDRFLKKNDRFFYHAKTRKIFEYLEKNYDIQSYDFVHAHSLFTNGLVAKMIYEKYGIPYVVALRNTDLNVFFRYLFVYRRDGVDIMKKSNHTIFLSKAYMERTVSKYIPAILRAEILGKCTVIPNGIDEFWLRNLQDNPKTLDEKLKILTVGSIEKNKNQIHVAKAINRLKESGINVEYTVIGDITDEKYFKQLKNVFPDLISLPFAKKEELISTYRQNSIFVMLSYKETFGLVYAEAMSQGLPVIYTQREGFDGQFEDGKVGHAIAATDVDGLVNSILKIVDNYQQYSRNAIEGAKSFDWRRLALSYKNIYEG